jgi:parvulin-like peptidyl-prolyl isomerase
MGDFHMYRKRALTLILLLTALCYAPSAQEKPSSTAEPPAAKPAEPATPVQPAPASVADLSPNLVVVRVSGEPITEKQVLSAIEVLSKQTVIKPEQKSQRAAILFKGALDNLVTVTILKSEARKQNITVDKARVDQQMQVFASQYPSKEEFEKAMARQGVNEAEVRKNVEETWSVQALLDSAVKNVPAVSDAEIQKIYDSNPFAAPERAHVAQLFLKFEPNSTPEQKAEVKKRLEGIRADIESKKLTFADAVAKYSQDPNAPKGGDVGFVARDQITFKPLEEAIFGTAPGNLATVVESPQGCHLVRVIEIKPAGKATMEEAKPEIKEQLEQIAKQRAMQTYMDELKSKATVENFMTAEEFDKRHPMAQ